MADALSPGEREAAVEVFGEEVALLVDGYEACDFNEAEGFMADRLYLINSYECERTFACLESDRGVFFHLGKGPQYNRENYVPFPMFGICRITPVRKISEADREST